MRICYVMAYVGWLQTILKLHIKRNLFWSGPEHNTGHTILKSPWSSLCEIVCISYPCRLFLTRNYVNCFCSCLLWYQRANWGSDGVFLVLYSIWRLDKRFDPMLNHRYAKPSFNLWQTWVAVLSIYSLYNIWRTIYWVSWTTQHYVQWSGESLWQLTEMSCGLY